MWLLNSTLGRVRGLFLTSRPGGETLGTRCLRQQHPCIGKAKSSLSCQMLSEAHCIPSGLQKTYPSSDMKEQTVSAVNIGTERRDKDSWGQPGSVTQDNNSASCARGLSSNMEKLWAAHTKSQPVRPLDLLAATNKGKMVLDMLGSPRSPDCSAIGSFIIKAIKLDPTPIKPLCKYNSMGIWELHPVATPNASKISLLVEQVSKVLEANNPVLSKLGTGGAYFLSENNMNVAVFKPVDEEPQARNNPRGMVPTLQVTMEGLKKGTRPGEGAWREYAAYLLDHGGFSGVPLTLMARLNKPGSGEVGKFGSLQQFVHHDYDTEECGTSIFPVHEVHKICVLDIRLTNTDRNGQNILVSRPPNGKCSLTPIDHGYALPDCYDDVCFEWMYYRQAEQPFSKEVIEYANSLNPEHDIELMERHGVVLRPMCLDVFRFSTYLLKWSVMRGLTAYDIASLMCKDAFQRKYDMPHAQVMFEFAMKLVDNGVLTETFAFKVLDAFSSLSGDC